MRAQALRELVLNIDSTELYFINYLTAIWT